MEELLIKLNACKEAIEWAGDRTIEEIVKECDRGDWLLWLAKKIGIELQPLTLAKGHCANTVRHLMENERSIKAVDMAIAFGEGRATMEELNNAAAASYAAAAASYAANAASYAAYVADAAIVGDASYAAYAAATAAAYAAAYAAGDAACTTAASAAKKQNQKETAEICRKYIGQLIIDKCNKLNTKIEMKTPIQELLERVKEYRDSENSPLVISRLNSICVDIFGMLDKEKEVIKNAYIEGCGDNILCESTDKKRAEEYYNETFNTKEK
jgi:hypothetical protein